MEAARERAEALLERGKTADAETVMAQALTEIEKQQGTQSADYFLGVEYLASCQVAGGLIERSIATLRRACLQPYPSDPAAQKIYLTLFMNLGDVLRRNSQLAEAEQFLRRGLTGRERFYGKTHAGYAFGLEPLADTLFAQGKVEEALPLYEETVTIFGNDNHPRLIPTLAHRALAEKALHPESKPFEDLSGNDVMWTQLGEALVEFATSQPDTGIAPGLWDAQAALAQHLGETHDHRAALLTILSNIERLSELEGSNGRWQKALMLATNLYHKSNQKDLMLQTMQGVAMAQSEAGDNTAAQATYERVAGLAQKMDNPAVHCRALRNLGLFLSQQDQRTAAEHVLRQALTVSAGVAMARSEHARAQIALGIFLQHGGNLTAAEPLLVEAIKTLPPDHPNSFPARNHLNAIRTNQSCGCGDGYTALLDGFQAYLDTQLPPEWRSKVHARLDPDDGGLAIKVEMLLGKGEPERLNHIVSHAWSAYLSRLQSHGFSENH